MWCFVLVHNDTPDVIENLSAQVTLVDESGQIPCQRAGLFAAKHSAAWCFPAADGIFPANESLPTPALKHNC